MQSRNPSVGIYTPGKETTESISARGLVAVVLCGAQEGEISLRDSSGYRRQADSVQGLARTALLNEAVGEFSVIVHEPAGEHDQPPGLRDTPAPPGQDKAAQPPVVNDAATRQLQEQQRQLTAILPHLEALLARTATGSTTEQQPPRASVEAKIRAGNINQLTNAELRLAIGLEARGVAEVAAAHSQRAARQLVRCRTAP